MFAPKDLLENKAGFLYEPRALWGFATYNQSSVTEGRPTIITNFDRDAFFNGSRWPIVLTHACAMIVVPGGYPILTETMLPLLGIRVGMRSGPKFGLSHVAPNLELGASKEAQTPGFFSIGPEGAGILQAGAGQDLPLVLSRSVTNTVRWEFDHTLKLPPDAFMELQLSNRVPTIIDTSTVQVTSDVSFYAEAPKQPALFPGTVYTQQQARDMQQLSNYAAAQRFGESLQPTTQLVYDPTIPPGEGGPGYVPVTVPQAFAGYFGGPAEQIYDPTLAFNSREMVRQKSTFALPTNLKGYAIHIDQRALEQEFVSTLGFGAPGSLHATTLARARSRNGGTGNWWWRGDAPTALVSPTNTPAASSPLSRAIALQPNEALSITVPNVCDFPIPAIGAPAGVGPVRQLVVYLSFCGYAVVED